MKSCRQIKAFPLLAYKDISEVETAVNDFCISHEVIDIKFNGLIIMVVYRDLREEHDD